MSLFHKGDKPEKGNSSLLASSLRDEKLKSTIILNAINDGVVLVDEQGVIQLFNPAAAEITGWSAEEASGLDWRLVFKFVDTKGQPVQDEQPTNSEKDRRHGQEQRAPIRRFRADDASSKPISNQDRSVHGQRWH